MTDEATPDSGSNAAATSHEPPLEALAGALVSSTVSSTLKESSTRDVHVATAFTLGWQMAEFYRPSRRRHSTATVADDLPGLSALDAKEQNALDLAAIEAALAKLSPAIRPSGLSLPSIASLSEALAAVADFTGRSEAIRQFHVNVLTKLTAADSRLGKAYGLGRALADTCIKPTAIPDLRDELRHYRIETLRAWIEDLESALPVHVGGSVSQSLAEWSAWSTRDTTSRDDGEVLSRIREQGRLWRGLMSGEKAATDMLGADDYVAAGTAMLRETQKLATGVFLRHWKLSASAFLVFVGGLALMLAVQSSASIVAGLSIVVTSLGLSWKTIGGSAGQAIGKLEQPVWGGALDGRVATAITLVPDRPEPSAFRDRDPAEIQTSAPSSAASS